MSSRFSVPSFSNCCKPYRQRSEEHTSGGAIRCRSRPIIFLKRRALSSVSLNSGYSSSKRYSSLGTTETMALILLCLKICFMNLLSQAKPSPGTLLQFSFHQFFQIGRGDRRPHLIRLDGHAEF